MSAARKKRIEIFKANLTSKPTSVEGVSRYQASLIFDMDKLPTLPENREYSLQRTLATENSMKRNNPGGTTLAEMESALSDLQGVAWEIVPQEELDNKPKHYIGFSYVSKCNLSSATTTTRPIHDSGSSANPHTPALNDVLIEAPDVENKILKVLIKARFLVNICVADIRRMFYCVTLEKEQRDMIRFYARKKVVNGETRLSLGDQEDPLVECRMMALSMGLNQAPILANLAKLDIARQLEEQDKVAGEQLRKLVVFRRP